MRARRLDSCSSTYTPPRNIADVSSKCALRHDSDVTARNRDVCVHLITGIWLEGPTAYYTFCGIYQLREFLQYWSQRLQFCYCWWCFLLLTSCSCYCAPHYGRGRIKHCCDTSTGLSVRQLRPVHLAQNSALYRVGLLVTGLRKAYCHFSRWIFRSNKQERDCLVHFVRLATALLKDEESARDKCCADPFPLLAVFFLLRAFNFCLLYLFIYFVLPYKMVK